MYNESDELKALTTELKKDNLSRRDSSAFETVDWYIKRNLHTDRDPLREKLQDLLGTWFIKPNFMVLKQDKIICTM